MEPFIGQIQAFGFNFAPRGWALCNGQLLPIAQYSALFSLLGTTYGGDGRTTFGLPDLRGRAPMHFGNGPGLTSRQLGQRGGAESVTLTTAQLPSHNHNLQSAPEGNTDEPVDNYIAGAGLNSFSTEASTTSKATTNSGGNLAHENMQPYLTINYCIALFGIFPSRS